MDSESGGGRAPRRPADEGGAGTLAAGASKASSVHSRARARLDAICERLRGGMAVSHACAVEGVPRQSFYDLIGRDPEAQVAVEAARAEAAEALKANIIALAQGGEGVRGANPNVLLHLLARLYPSEYGPPVQRVEQTTVTLTPERRREVYAELRSQGLLVAGADAELEAECVAAGLLPADVVDGEVEG